MALPSIEEPEELIDREPVPHLSFSRINRYLTCPEQYRLHYVEKLRPKKVAAAMLFGALMHVALADFFREGISATATFKREWQNLKNIEIHYGNRDSWESLGSKGEKLLEKFLQEEVAKIQKVYGVEKKFELAVTTIALPFIGAVDLIAQMEGQTTIVDFKTAASDYDEHEVVLSDQLTAYWLADPSADRVAYCVLAKTKEPMIQWHFGKRNVSDLQEFLTKVRLVLDDIAAGKFYKRPGKHCRYCDFLPMCVGNQQKVQDTLVRIT
jgi:CRISPR/Cas system-associated exonuclease Cas4 (RecB family)